jgi:hypothetical protein
MVEIIRTILSWLPKGSYMLAQNTHGELANGKNPPNATKRRACVIIIM